MGFFIQYSCPECGYRTKDNGLFDPLGMPELYICSCNDCHHMFHRKSDENKNPIDQCIECGSTNITIHDDVSPMPCPVCGREEMELECTGTFF